MGQKSTCTSTGSNRAVSVGEGGAVKGVRRRLVGRMSMRRRKDYFFLSRRILWLESEGGGEKDGQ